MDLFEHSHKPVLGPFEVLYVCNQYSTAILRMTGYYASRCFEAHLALENPKKKKMKALKVSGPDYIRMGHSLTLV